LNHTPSTGNLSLIVPVRNEEKSIAEFLESLLGQTLQPAEIIIADGGSEDRTKEIIREYKNRGHNLRLIESGNAYPGKARNLAIQAATTEWVALTDAGTVVEKDWLEKLVAQTNDADIVLGSYEPILSTFFKECLALSFVAPAMKVEGGVLRGPSTASMMIRKPVWQALGCFPEELRACEDLLFFERFAKANFNITHAPEAVVRWHIPDNFSAVFRRFRTYSFHTLKAGLGKSWHLAVCRMYGIGLIFFALAVFHHWLWVLLPLLGLAGRIYKTIRIRRPSLALRQDVGLLTWALVGVILLCIDAALFKGAWDYLFSRQTNEEVTRKAKR
jgi:glycosyltransferase involved in cell wall biosynthesis